MHIQYFYTQKIKRATNTRGGEGGLKYLGGRNYY